MTTDADRKFAIEHARKIYEYHLARSGGDGAHNNHIATTIGYEETLRRGLLAECDFSDRFGVPVNVDITEGGDGGKDFRLPLRTNRGVEQFDVDVKTKSVRSNFNGMIKVGTHLRVPVRFTRPKTIYVFAIYNEQYDDAKVLRWQWGATLIKNNERMVFENGNNEEAFTQRFEECRLLGELLDRLEMERTDGTTDTDRTMRVHSNYPARQLDDWSRRNVLH